MTDLITEEMSVPSEPGIDIYVRNKRPADLTSFSPQPCFGPPSVWPLDVAKGDERAAGEQSAGHAHAPMR